MEEDRSKLLLERAMMIMLVDSKLRRNATNYKYPVFRPLNGALDLEFINTDKIENVWMVSFLGFS